MMDTQADSPADGTADHRPPDRAANPSRDRAARQGVQGVQGAALLVGAVGIVCSLALGAVVQRAAISLDAARLATSMEQAVAGVDQRLRALENALSATAAYLDTVPVHPAGSVPGALPPGLPAFIDRAVLPLTGALAVALGDEAGPRHPLAGAMPVAPRTGEGQAAGEPAPLLSVPAPGGGRLWLAVDVAPILAAADDGAGMWRSVRLLPAGPGEAAGAPAAGPTAGSPVLSHVLSAGDRSFLLQVVPTAAALPGGVRMEALAVLCFGLALTLLTAAHAQTVQRRARRTAELAERLEATNGELRRRVAERESFAVVVRESEQRYRDIYENAIEGIFTTTPRGRFLSANPSLVRMLGFTAEAELTAAVEDIGRQLYVDPARRDAFIRLAEVNGMVQDFEAEARRRDGSTIWLSLTARAVRDGAGDLIALQGTAQDITARHAAEEALRQAKKQADIANRAKTEFLANMSHELRTPLNAIIGFSEIIGEQSLGPIGNAAYAEYARDIHEGGRMLLDLINDILDLSKIEAGRKELTERTVDVPRLVRASLRLVRERALKGGVELATDLPDGLPPVWADEIALKQILSNLLSNAVKFTPAGGTVTAGAGMTADGRLELRISDTGIGMRAEDIPKALEPFRQIEGSLARSTGGVGLGLPLVQALISLHGGGLVLDSVPGAGTTARVWLPPDRLRLAPALASVSVSVSSASVSSLAAADRQRTGT